MRARLVHLLLIACALLAPLAAAATEPQRHEFKQIEMAVDFRIVLYADDAEAAAAAAKAAFARIAVLNGVMSDYDGESELRRACEQSGPGKPVAISDDLWRVLSKAQEMAERSDGAFDATCGQVVRLWRRARRQGELPPEDRLRTAREQTGYRFVRLDAERKTIELLRTDMRIDLGGIAKGYATQEALAVLRSHGIRSAMIEGGGDIALGESPPGKTGWRIGIAPVRPEGPPRFFLTASQTTVATSGDMWQYVVIDGVRYSHIVDPRTGIGLTHRSHVTVVHADGPTADALATAVSVLGHLRGLELVDATPGAAALVTVPKGDKIEIHASKRWQDLAIDRPATGL
jgi:thiamine biosynthesis lipoprotein